MLKLASSATALSLCLTAVTVTQTVSAIEPAETENENIEQRATDRAGQSGGPEAASNEASRASGQQQQLTDYFVDTLMLANQGEIEASQFAAQKTSNQQVKQFAEMLIQDHQKLDEKLKQLSPGAAAQFAEHSRRFGGRLTDRLAGRPDGDRSAPDRPLRNRPPQTRTGARDLATHDTLTRLCMINHQACANHRQMSKQMLESYQGQDFDMAFLGMQIGQHAWLLSELEALNGVGTPEFQQIVTEARQNVEQHLKRAKELSQKFEDDRSAPRDS
jgi:predicted outer membrane protein